MGHCVFPKSRSGWFLLFFTFLFGISGCGAPAVIGAITGAAATASAQHKDLDCVAFICLQRQRMESQHVTAESMRKNEKRRTEKYRA